MINGAALTAALKGLGVCDALVGNPLVAAGMAPLGMVEGEVRAAVPQELNSLTTEQTGQIPHDSVVVLGQPNIVVPLIMGNPDLWAQVSATGSEDGGNYEPQAPVYTSLLLIPKSEMAGGLAYDGVAWTRTAGRGYAGATGADAEPKNALWFWKVVPLHPGDTYRFAEGGKVVTPITCVPHLDDTKPDGQLVYTRGNPVAKGITTLRL